MKRRGNKSHRVPNVKLRPAAPGTNPRTSAQPVIQKESVCWAQETQETGAFDSCPRPFKDVVLCATGIPDKPSLFKQALELGATSTSAFTSRVTHLIATDHGGPKYRCALERQIPILRPSWITECYHVWLKGDDVDFEESVKAHKLPLFSGVVLSFSGQENYKRQAEMKRMLTVNDGVYLENLERPVKITHILCSGDEETDKMRYARKFNQRGEANIHLIWEEWLWDSLEFGGRFNEADYNVQQPRPQRRICITDETQPPSTAMSEPSSSTSRQYDSPPTPPDEEEEIACVAHRAGFTLQIWGNLLKNRGYEVVNGKVVKNPSKAPPKCPPPLDIPRADSPDSNAMDIDPPKAKSVLSTVRRANSFAPLNEPSQKSRASQRLQPFRRSTSVFAAAEPQKPRDIQGPASHAMDAGAQAGPSTIGPRGLFSGLKFRVLGEARSPTVRNAIEQANGIWMSEQDIEEDVDYIIVRLVSGSKLYREEPDEVERTKYRTECWLERCLHEERICPHQDHVTFLPLGIQLPVPSTESVVMSFSGLDQSEICWLTRLLRALGIQLAQAFSRRTTHLLCPSGTGLKYEKAKEWDIPVVNWEWLATIATTGSVPPVSGYLVPLRLANDPGTANDSTNIIDTKGKGKEKEGLPARAIDMLDAMMTDITNGRADKTRPITKDVNTAGHAQQIPRQSSEWQTLPPAQRPEPPDNGEGISFGQPCGLLGAGQGLVPPNPATLMRKNLARTQESFIMDNYGLRNELDSSLSPQLQQAEVVPSLIPSSKTPSPMKIPREGSAASLLLPMKIGQALQESVTSLLGKRPGEDEGGRGGKRSRPHRRPMSKQSSTSSLNFDIRLASEPDGMPLGGGEDGKKLNVFETGPEPAGADSTAEIGTALDESFGPEKSMWVMYEDPGQVDERKRLMTLLRNPTGDAEVVLCRPVGPLGLPPEIAKGLYYQQWISWFLSSKGNEYFCEVDEDFILDRFNLTGLNNEVANYSQALDLITDTLDDDIQDDLRGSLDVQARLLYGLIHARWIVTARGLQKMLEKYKRADFGRCPRVYCQSQPLLPVGLTDVPYQKSVKLYCGRCEDLYSPKSSRHGSIDGAYFGTTFPHLLFLVYPSLVPPKSGPPDFPGVNPTANNSADSRNRRRTREELEVSAAASEGGGEGVNTASVALKAERYKARIYGFQVNEVAKLQRWQEAVRDRQIARLEAYEVRQQQHQQQLPS